MIQLFISVQLVQTIYSDSLNLTLFKGDCKCWSLGHAENLLFSCLLMIKSQNSKVIGENGNVFLDTSFHLCLRFPAKNVECFWQQVGTKSLYVWKVIVCHAVILSCFQMLMLILGTYWTFVFTCMLKSDCLSCCHMS